MKKIVYLAFLILVSNILWSCATTNQSLSAKYSASEFSNENYQIIFDQASNLSDSLANFESVPQVELDPADFSVLMQADINFNQADYKDAAPAYIMLSKKYQDPRIIYKAISSLNYFIVDKDQEQALAEMIALLETAAPNSSITKLLDIRQSLKSDNIAKANADIDFIIKANPDKIRIILFFVSSNISGLSNINEAWATDILRKYGNYPEAHLLASIIYASNDNTQQVDSQVAYIRNTYPNWEMPYLMLSSIYVKAENWNDIVNMLNVVTKNSPELSIMLQNVYIIALIKNKQPEKAQAYLQQRLNNLSAESEDNAMRGNIYLNMAILQLDKQNYTAGIDYLKLAESNGRQLNGSVPLLIGAIYDYQENYLNALQYYNKISDNALLAQISKLAIIRDYLTLNDFVAVNKAVDQLASDNKFDARKSILLKSAFYIDAAKYQQAYEILSKNLKTYANDKEYLYQYASTLAMLNKNKEAISVYEKCVKLDSKNALSYNDLAYVLVTQTKDTVRAKKLAEKALTLDPNNFAVLDTLGWVYYKQASYAKALVYTKQAYGINPDAEIATHLKQIYIALGNQAEANKIVITKEADKQAEFRQFVLDKAAMLVIYFQYGIEHKQ